MIQNNLLIVALNWPEPQATAAGQRMMQLISFFLEIDYHITFACTAAASSHSRVLDDMGISIRHIVVNQPGFDYLVSGLEPEIVLFDRFISEEQFGWRVVQFAPAALRILDTEDLHSLRAARKDALESGIPFSVDAWLQSDMAKREIAAIFRCDLSLIISRYEMDLLQELLPIIAPILAYFPLVVDEISQAGIQKWPSFSSREDFICIGNGKHGPNTDSFLWLFEVIWPLIRKAMPRAIVHIYGAYLPERILQLNRPQLGFLVQGHVEDSGAVMRRSRVNLAPLRFGAGLKGKLIEAMACGTPSVTTNMGIEGLGDTVSAAAYVSDHPEAFAALAVGLYTNEADWTALQGSGTALINSSFGKKEHGSRLRRALRQVQEDLHAHRSRNFMGSLLLHHTMASTKYLSKWITAKNSQTQTSTVGGTDKVDTGLNPG